MDWGSLVSTFGSMVGNVVEEVFGELAGLLDQVAQMVTADPVEHPASVTVGEDQAGQAQSPEMLRHRGPGRCHLCGEGGHVLLALDEQPQQMKPGGVGQMSQDIRGERELFARDVLSH